MEPLPDSVEEKLSKVNAEVATLEAEIVKQRDWLTQYGDPDFDPTMRVKFAPQFLKLDVLKKQLDDARQRQLAFLLTSLNDSTSRLNLSAQKQLAAATDIAKSSRRLENMTNLLLILTATLMLFAAVSYLVQPFPVEGYLFPAGFFIVMTIVYFFFRSRRHDEQLVAQ
jgi:hypothetical protein